MFKKTADLVEDGSPKEIYSILKTYFGLSASTKRIISLKIYVQVNASSVCRVQKQWSSFTQYQWFYAPPGFHSQSWKNPPKCRDRSGCPYCRRDPRHEGRRQAPRIQPGFQVANDYGDLPIQGPALEYHQQGNPVLPVELKLGFT